MTRPRLNSNAKKLTPLFFAKWDYRCVYCSQVFHPNDLTRDHIIPVSDGGVCGWSNIAPACKSCNQAKQATDLSYLRAQMLHEEASRIRAEVISDIGYGLMALGAGLPRVESSEQAESIDNNQEQTECP